MRSPPRDTVEFTAGLLLGTLVGVGLASLALRRGRGSRAAPGAGGLVATFFDAARAEMRRLLEEAADGLKIGAFTNGGSS